jgi:hypothetical protein
MSPFHKNHYKIIGIGVLAAAIGFLIYELTASSRPTRTKSPVQPKFESSEQLATSQGKAGKLRPRILLDASGYLFIIDRVKPWSPNASLREIAAAWEKPGVESIREVERQLKDPALPPEESVRLRAMQASCWIYEGQPEKALEILDATREHVEGDRELEAATLSTLIYMQGVASLRLGETENCVMCRGENSCILPLQPAAQHTKQTGSRKAIKHFTEYLRQFPDDLEVRWLLNIAHMTLGEHPAKVDPQYLIELDRYNTNEHGIGKFRDVGHLLGINRLNMAGGAILDDFDSDGLLDMVFSTMDPGMPLAFYRNQGDGRFADRSAEAGLKEQLGGLMCVQADYDNDGHLDIFVPRGAWLKNPMRPSLLKNTGGGKFSDVTEQAGLLHPTNSDNAQFADFDNDGWLDLFVCGEAQPSKLFRNKGDGTFEDVTRQAGLDDLPGMWKGLTWFDYDNDDFPDIFLNDYTGTAKLLHNDRDGRFTDTTEAMGIRGPDIGLACWTWDYDNDGWLDIFATSYDKTLGDAVKGLLGKPHKKKQSKLYRNKGGQGFEDVTESAGLTECLQTMGCNFGDFDNDGFLDIYLGTGDHDVATLVPNRMFRNLGGSRFVDITSSSGTGHLQKGHAVGCGDWDRDGDVDITIEMGGAIPGDKYHNVLFLNPGQGNHWLNVKLVGDKSNRSAIGARIKVVTAGDEPLRVQRTVCSGSSFGANPLEQLIGLGKHDRIESLEIHWPTSGITQVFKDIAADQQLEITEGKDEYKTLAYQPIPLVEE